MAALIKSYNGHDEISVFASSSSKLESMIITGCLEPKKLIVLLELRREYLTKDGRHLKGNLSGANQSLSANHTNINLGYWINIQGEGRRRVGGGICKSVITQSKGGSRLEIYPTPMPLGC